MELSESCSQPGVDKNKLVTKRKSKLLSYSKKEKQARVFKNTTLDNFLVTSPTKSEEGSSTSCSSHTITKVREDKFVIEKEIKSEYFSTDSTNNGRVKSGVFSNVSTNVYQSCSDENETRNVVLKLNNLKDNSSLNDSTEYFIENSKSHVTECDNEQANDMIEPYSEETPNKDVFRIEGAESTAGAVAVVQTKRIQCPLCLKMVEKYVTHIKACAAKRKLTTQQLMMALELQKKQAEERLALGLPLLPQKLPITRKTGNNRGGKDANLDLALALSASMKEAEEKQILEEADVLSQAGLKTEAAQKRNTLEGFGFASSRPRTGIARHKARPLMLTTLMTRTQEERERIISEKVSNVLISDDASSMNAPEELYDVKPAILSKKLSKQLNLEWQLWKKASVDQERSSYYVQELGEFVIPTTAEIGCNLRHLSQIAGRLNTPKKDDDTSLHPFTPPSQTLSESAEEKQLSPATTNLPLKPVTDVPLLDIQLPSNVSRDFSLVTSWRGMLGNCYMSDVNIVLTRDNVHIPAHKLVIYVRCKPMFNDIIIDSSCQDSIVLHCCSQTACVAFLEYLYCATVNNLSELSDAQFNELKALAIKYGVNELQKLLEDGEITSEIDTESSSNNDNPVRSARRRLFEEKKRVIESDDNSTTTGVPLVSSSLLDNIYDQTTMIISPVYKIPSDSYSKHNFLNCISQKENSEISSDDNIKSETEDCSQLVSIYDQTTVMVYGASSPELSCQGSSAEEAKPAQNNVHKNLDMLLSLLQKDDVGTSLPFHSESPPKDVSPVGVSLECIQDRLESSAKYKKRKHLSDRDNNSDSDDGDYGNDSKPKSAKKPCYEKLEVDSTQNSNDGGNNDYDLTQNPGDKNEDCNLIQDLNLSEKEYYDLTQITDDEIDNYDLTQKLNEENDDNNREEEIRTPGDNVMVLNSATETDDGTNQCLSSKTVKADCTIISVSNESSFDSKSEPKSNLLHSKSVPATYELDEKAFIDPIWDGFEDLNCNINDAWQNDSPDTLQKSKDTAIEKTPSVKSVSQKDTSSDSSDMSPRTRTPIKTLLEDMETRSPTFNIFGKKTESIKSLTFESFFKNERLRQEINITDDDKICDKSLPSLLLPGFETSDICHNSNKNTQTLESALKQCGSNKTGHQLSDLLTEYHGNSKGSTKLDSKIQPQEYGATVVSRICKNNINKQHTTENIHIVSESSESDCDENENPNSASVLSRSQCSSNNILDTHRVHESGSQRNSINQIKDLLDDSFEINNTVLLRVEEEAKMSRVAGNSQKKLSQSRSPDRVRNIFEAVTPKKLLQSPERTRYRTSDTRTLERTERISKVSKCSSPRAEKRVSKSVSSVNVAETVSTPSPQIIVSDKVTPMPNYGSMDTPLLKKELQRFGLKQSLGRNKSVRLLQYIYDQTHPVIPASRSQQINNNTQGTEEAKKSLFKSASQPLPKRVETAVSESDSESSSGSCTYESDSSTNDKTDDENDNDCDDDNTQSTTSNSQASTRATAAKFIKISCDTLDNIMRQTIQNDVEFYSRLLTYESVPLVEFIDKLKTLGYKAKGSEVRRYLDSQCIVYQLPKNKNQMHSRKERQRKRPVCASDSNRS